jgi:hypothetical protein
MWQEEMHMLQIALKAGIFFQHWMLEHAIVYPS